MTSENQPHEKKPRENTGPILAALIAAAAALIVAYMNLPGHPEVTIHNKLLTSIHLYVDDDYQGKLGSNQTTNIKLDKTPVNISYEIVNATTKYGTAIGDQVKGNFYRISGGEKLEVSYEIEDRYYFYLVLNNNTGKDCEVSVNDSLPSEQQAGVLRGNSHNVQFGYYKWFSNSNVTLYCGEKIYWWGEREGEKKKSMDDLINSVDASVALTLE